MGIADFGVTSATAGATAYEYFSPSFQGTAVVRSLSVTITGSSSKVTAFELNAVLYLERGGVNYSYWIQDGLHLDTGSDQFTIGGAYVWNFSSPSARLSPGELQGNPSSTLVSDTYYFIPNCAASFPGQCTTLTLPATVTGRIVSSTNGTTPYVDFQYDVGGGWVTYDNVSFLHMAGAFDAGFRVDGFAPTPIASALLYDAEWDWVGAGGGSASVDQRSDIDLTLDRWNGQNYQAVPTAWDFGSNTGETSSNVSDLPALSGTGSPSAHLISGPGSLGLLYNLSNVGFVNVSLPDVGPTTLVVDGLPVPLTGNWANLTLISGTHSLYLENYSNASAGFSVSAGATTFVNLSGAGALTVSEVGLPAATSWGISVNGVNVTSAGTSLVIHLANGTYPIAYRPVPGYYRTGSDPAVVTVPGVSRVSLTFVAFTFPVTFSESGLPMSTAWWVNANGTIARGTGTSLQVSLPNGSTPFEVGASYAFLANPPNGTVDVVGGRSGTVTVDFAFRPAYVDGLVNPANALITIDGVLQALSGGEYNDSVIPGTYVVSANATGFAGQQVSITTTPGNVTWVNFTLVRLPVSPANPSPTGPDGSAVWVEAAAAVILGGVVIATGVLLVLRRRRR